MYGHLDKQPEFEGWRSDLGPWTPKYEDGKLYGRGGADDGYAVYASVAAIQALKSQNVLHPRIVGMIETTEESGSRDLLPYVDALRPRLGNVGLVICLDSGAGNYDQLWLTTSLRGMASGTLKVQILTEGMHSGDASGRGALIISHPAPGARPPGGQRHRPHAARQLSLRRPHRACDTGPGHRRHLGQRPTGTPSRGRSTNAAARSPWLPCPSPPTPSKPCSNAPGIPPCPSPVPKACPPCKTRAMCCGPTPRFNSACACRHWSMPPPACKNEGLAGRQRALPSQSHLGRQLKLQRLECARHDHWFESALNPASRAHFGADCGYIGQGGTIPLMNLLSQGFPKAQMMVCGVLGPKSNAHGPNEFLHVPYAKKLTAAVAQVIAAMPVTHPAQATTEAGTDSASA